MRITVLSDIHGNLPALEAVLATVDAEQVVVLGDVVSGPMPREVLERLTALDLPIRWVRGNADRLVVDAFDAGANPDATTDPVERGDRWVARQLDRQHRDLLAAFEPTVSLDGVLFCHGSPRSDTECITAVTPADRLRELLAEVDERLVVCGHTHHQFVHEVDGRRVANAGSIGMPYQGDAAAFWMTVEDGEPRLRRTTYDVPAALGRLRASGYPDVEETVLRESLIEPVSADWVARHFEPDAQSASGGA